ncbi:MAG: type II toxin-antitoxin system VapC family toxin [Solirubrobacteraceae bacterium]
MRRLLDADVLISALDRNDAHHPQARHLLTEWRQRQDAVMISAINLSEVLIAPSANSSRLTNAREAIAALGIEAHLPNEAIAVDAARLRQRYPVSLPDAYCLATAKHTRSTLASFDQKVLKAAKAEGLGVI